MFFAENDLSLELLGAFKIKRGQYYLKSPRPRTYDSLSIRLSGTGNFTIRESVQPVSRGDVLYIPKNEVYSHRTDGETIIALHFINYSYHSENTFEVLTVDDRDRVEGLFSQIYDAWKEKKSGYRYRCTALLYELLYDLHRHEKNRSVGTAPCGEKLSEAVDYIHTHFRSDTISITELCRSISVSDTYFRKLFRKNYGLSPKQYIINLRLELASQLLQSQFYSIAEAAEKAGFSDPKYFSKLFRKRFGVSPKQFQQDVEKGLKIE